MPEAGVLESHMIQNLLYKVVLRGNWNDQREMPQVWQGEDKPDVVPQLWHLVHSEFGHKYEE